MTPLEMIEAERQRQIESEGWDAAHDDQHTDGELLRVAVYYYLSGTGQHITVSAEDGAPLGWSWEAKWWKPKSPERDLVRAGALCLAERGRLRRKRSDTVEWNYCHVDQKLTLIVKALSELQPA